MDGPPVFTGKGDVYKHNKSEFDWYCSRFFDFRRVLKPIEIGYLDYCFGLVEDSFVERQQISCKTFVHRISGEKIDSTGLGYGFRMETDERRRFFHQTLSKLIPSLSFGGLIGGCDAAGIGWNVQTSTLRAYFYFLSLPRDIVGFSSVESFAKDCSDERLIGLTLRDGKVIEEKWYVYPFKERWDGMIERYAGKSGEVQHALSGCSDRLALMVSDVSSPKFQFDILQDRQKDVVRMIDNPCLRRIFDDSIVWGQTFDTVSIHDGVISAYFE